jgi:hypothetical protein
VRRPSRVRAAADVSGRTLSTRPTHTVHREPSDHTPKSSLRRRRLSTPPHKRNLFSSLLPSRSDIVQCPSQCRLSLSQLPIAFPRFSALLSQSRVAKWSKTTLQFPIITKYRQLNICYLERSTIADCSPCAWKHSGFFWAMEPNGRRFQEASIRHPLDQDLHLCADYAGHGDPQSKTQSHPLVLILVPGASPVLRTCRRVPISRENLELGT